MPSRPREPVGGTVATVPETVLTPQIREEIARLERADIMVGIPSFKNAATIGYVVRAAQAGLVQYFPDLRPVVVNSDAGSPDGTQRGVVETEPPEYVERILLVRPTNRLARGSLTYPEVDGSGGKGAALWTIFEIAAALDMPLPTAPRIVGALEKLGFVGREPGRRRIVPGVRHHRGCGGEWDHRCERHRHGHGRERHRGDFPGSGHSRFGDLERNRWCHSL